MTKLEERRERACRCVHMLDGGACGNWPEAREGGRTCPIYADPRDGFCPFNGFYAFREKLKAQRKGHDK